MNKYDQLMQKLGACFLREDIRIEPTEPLVEAVEAKISQALPSDYREFLLDYGGSALPGGRVSVFYGFYEELSYDLLSAIEAHRDQVPEHFLPIADDLPGNLYCLSLDGPSKGAVFYWDRDTAEILLVSEDFDSFLESIEPEDEFTS